MWSPKKTKIKDNFLDQEEFDKIQTLIMGNEFPWRYTQNVTYDVKDKRYTGKEINKFQFVHMFYQNTIPHSAHYTMLVPIFEKLFPVALFRIKANLLTRTPNIVEHEFHIDMREEAFTTAIFYMNTNNGYTKLEDGTKVDSVANRMVTFPATMKHSGTTCTDEKVRVVINFNYFEDRIEKGKSGRVATIRDQNLYLKHINHG